MSFSNRAIHAECSHFIHLISVILSSLSPTSLPFLLSSSIGILSISESCYLSTRCTEVYGHLHRNCQTTTKNDHGSLGAGHSALHIHCHCYEVANCNHKPSTYTWHKTCTQSLLEIAALGSSTSWYSALHGTLQWPPDCSTFPPWAHTGHHP